MGELAERREVLFSVCRSDRWVRFGESMIIAETVEVEEIADSRRESGSSVWGGSSWDGQPISSWNRSIDGLAFNPFVVCIRSRSVCSRIKEVSR